MEKLIYDLLCRVYGRDYVDAVIAAENNAKSEEDAAIDAAIDGSNDNGG